MRYCRKCHRLASGNPSFCLHCGRSYNAKRCPAGHVNPRGALACGSCGSTDLSEPQPRRGTGAALLLLLLVAAFVMSWSVYIVIFMRALFTTPDPLLPLMLIGLGLGFLWVLFVSA